MSITAIKDNILSRLGNVLGNEYSKLSYVTDVKQNKFGRTSKRFGVLPGSATEISGTLQHVTMDHQFSITLTDSFNSGATAQLNDNLKAERINELQDKVLSVYRDLVLQARNLSANVLSVNNLQIDDPEFVDDEKVIIQKFSINIKYRN